MDSFPIFSHNNINFGFKNITVISNDGMLSTFPRQYKKAVNLMISSTGRYDQKYRDMCGLEGRIKVIKSNVISIDRWLILMSWNWESNMF